MEVERMGGEEEGRGVLMGMIDKFKWRADNQVFKLIMPYSIFIREFERARKAGIYIYI